MSDFYVATLRRLLADGWLRTDDRVLVVCGGEVDRGALLAVGLTDVTISNLDDRMTTDGESRYAPYSWDYQDAESLTCADNSYDICIVHDGLHRCRSPYYALAEMLRVAQRGVVAFEPRDNGVTRLGIRLNSANGTRPQQSPETSSSSGVCATPPYRTTSTAGQNARWRRQSARPSPKASRRSGTSTPYAFPRILNALRSPVQRRLVERGLPVMRGLARVFASGPTVSPSPSPNRPCGICIRGSPCSPEPSLPTGSGSPTSTADSSLACVFAHDHGRRSRPAASAELHLQDHEQIRTCTPRGDQVRRVRRHRRPAWAAIT